MNEANVYDSTRDLVQALTLEAADASKGVFNIYDATYGANNNLINSSDEHIARSVRATFWSAVTEQDEMDQVERLAWYIPRRNTMIKAPVEGQNYHTRQRVPVKEDLFTQNAFYVRANGANLLNGADELKTGTGTYADSTFRTSESGGTVAYNQTIIPPTPE